MTAAGMRVFEYLRQNRIMTEVLEDGNLLFRYGDGSTFLFTGDEGEDFTYCSFAVPGVCDVDDDNRSQMVQVANYVNCSTKLAKTLVYNDSVWIYYEILAYPETKLDEMMPLILNVLNNAKNLFLQSV